jgi:hypothetical protein
MAAGYVDGPTRNYFALLGKCRSAGTAPTYCQHGGVVSVAVSASDDADCLAVVRGDAAPVDVPAWVRRQLARGVQRPIVWAAITDFPTINTLLKADGLSRSEVREWDINTTGITHVDPGFDATQWTAKALNIPGLDESLVLWNSGYPIPPAPQSTLKLAVKRKPKLAVKLNHKHHSATFRLPIQARSGLSVSSCGARGGGSVRCTCRLAGRQSDISAPDRAPLCVPGTRRQRGRQGAAADLQILDLTSAVAPSA